MAKSFVRSILCSLLALCAAPLSAQTYYDLHARRITFTNNSGPTITSGTGAPSSSEPNGSIYLRVTTGATTLYCRQDSAWTTNCSGVAAGANASGYYFVSRSTNAPTNAVNFGALTTGILKHTVSGSISTPATATAGTDYVKPDVGTVGKLIPDADGTRDLGGSSSQHWNVAFLRRIITEGFTSSAISDGSANQINGFYSGVGGSLANGFQALIVNGEATVSTDVTAGTYRHFAAANIQMQSHGSHKFQTTVGAYIGNATSATETFDTFSNTNGGGQFALITDAYAGGTGAVGVIASHLCWGGTASGSNGTNFYCNYVPQLYEFAGSFTNFVGYQVDDLSTMTGFTNKWPFRYSAPIGDNGTMSDGTVKVSKTTVASLPTCNSAHEGGMVAVSDSNTATWGATIAAGGSNHVLGYCNGTNWTVMGK